SDYRDARGSKGNYLKYLKVYGRGGQPCLACGKNLEKQRIAGRGTHWCKNCQS
ncbi:DNA-formamidopyrimidine glycosylase, partial [Candidatus Falkowbacteria bacterium]|nr:DNA-formamidopyrimidine glycosylase [Candidatus Falkowbacteria bacterium]